ncbi:MAG: isoaspartyl peptidase/L-asparaginase [Candidatus Sericytochromatia bacterium]|nr:isoaspartyl peptidase/L-asparaginase [Candidatus Sericytochromatia bacterium]
MPQWAIAVHGGVGNSPDNLDGCHAAAACAADLLRDGADALEAAVAAVVKLEDDGRFNAGRGSSLRMDGETVEMDAACMDSSGRLGAVAALQRVRNPILVARAVLDTPHWLMVGDGAERFARTLGHAVFKEVTPRARAIHARVMEALASDTPYDFQDEWRTFDYKAQWNFPTAWQEVVRAHGTSTVGAVAMDANGLFAVAGSTGGSSPMLYGRVGDTPIVGCGFYAGPAGAIACTGIGEEIVKEFLARTVYGWLAEGMPLQEALDKGVALFPAESIDIGLIGVTREGGAWADNRQMPASVLSAV